MPLIDKAYFTLEELEERWSLPRRDIAYLAENGILRLSVRVFGVRIERAYLEQTAEGEWFDIPYEHTNHWGLLDLTERDVFELFRDGSTTVTCFHHPGEIIRLIEHTPSLDVRVSDIVVRREERDRVEVERILYSDRVEARCDPPRAAVVASSVVPPTRPPILISDSCSEIRIGDIELRLGRIQARVVRDLREAARSGDPWRDGRELLQAAGSRSLRMCDVFKSKSGWRHLILSDGRGKYRIVVD